MTFPRYGCANRNSFRDPAEYLVELARVEEERHDKNDIKYIFPSSIQVNTLDPLLILHDMFEQTININYLKIWFGFKKHVEIIMFDHVCLFFATPQPQDESKV